MHTVSQTENPPKKFAEAFLYVDKGSLTERNRRYGSTI